MGTSKFGRRLPTQGVVLSFLLAACLVPISQALATPQMHFDGSGREQPWDNCTTCHGPNLNDGFAPACTTCHNDFSSPDTPPTGHHMPGREDPLTNCVLCHGSDLTGDIGPSCFTCHDQLWSGGGGGNAPPVVDAGGPYAGAPGQDIQFDASGTTDPDGDTLIYLWTFGDGTPPQFPSQSPTATHAYEDAGNYTAAVTVTDGSNDPVIVQVDVTIGGSNDPPTVDAGGPYSGTAGQAVLLDGSGSSDPDGDSLEYLWEFGDSTQPQGPGASATASHVYQSAGTYTATLTITDGINDPVFQDVTVQIQADGGGGGGGGGNPLPTGDVWDVQFPFLGIQGTVEFKEFFHILLVNESIDGGPNVYGLGFRLENWRAWLDVSGSFFLGTENSSSDNMWGLAFNMLGSSNTIWFASPTQPAPALDLGSLGDLLDLGGLIPGLPGTSSGGSGSSGSGAGGSTGTSGSGTSGGSGATGGGGTTTPTDPPSSPGGSAGGSSTPGPSSAYDVYSSRSGRHSPSFARSRDR